MQEFDFVTVPLEEYDIKNSIKLCKHVITEISEFVSGEIWYCYPNEGAAIVCYKSMLDWYLTKVRRSIEPTGLVQPFVNDVKMIKIEITQDGASCPLCFDLSHAQLSNVNITLLVQFMQRMFVATFKRAKQICRNPVDRTFLIEGVMETSRVYKQVMRKLILKFNSNVTLSVNTPYVYFSFNPNEPTLGLSEKLNEAMSFEHDLADLNEIILSDLFDPSEI